MFVPNRLRRRCRDLLSELPPKPYHFAYLSSSLIFFFFTVGIKVKLSQTASLSLSFISDCHHRFLLRSIKPKLKHLNLCGCGFASVLCTFAWNHLIAKVLYIHFAYLCKNFALHLVWKFSEFLICVITVTLYHFIHAMYCHKALRKHFVLLGRLSWPIFQADLLTSYSPHVMF